MQSFTTFEKLKLLLIFLLASQGTVDCKISFGKLSTVVGLVQKGADLVSQMFDFVQSSKKSDNEELVQQYTAELDSITEELKSGIQKCQWVIRLWLQLQRHHGCSCHVHICLIRKTFRVSLARPQPVCLALNVLLFY